MKVLEPSAGKGDIACHLKELDVELSVIEIIPSLRQILELKGFNVVGWDFLEHEGDYDRIVMNSPFEQFQDIKHIQHAYDCLAPGGRLVSIVSESPFFRKDKTAVEFREWLFDVDLAEEIVLKDKIFFESDRPTGVKCRILVLRNPPEIIT